MKLKHLYEAQLKTILKTMKRKELKNYDVKLDCSRDLLYHGFVFTSKDKKHRIHIKLGW